MTPPLSPPDLSQAVDFVRSNPAMTAGITEAIRERLGFSVGGVLAANAGLLLSLSVLLLFVGGDDPSPWAVVIIGILLALVGWIVSLALRFVIENRYPTMRERFVPFATVMAVVGLVTAVIGLAVASVADSRSSSPSTSLAWWPYLLLAFLLLGAWVIPGLQGRPFVLGAALLNFTWAFCGLVAVSVNERRLRYSTSSLLSTGGYYYDPQEVVRSAAAAGLIAGLLFLTAVLLLDWRGWRGLATPFLVAGIAATLSGAIGVASDASVLSVLFLALCVVLVIIVGMLGRRKATIWFGGLVLSPALVAVCVKMLGDDPNHIVAGIFIGVVGTTVLIAAFASVFYGPVVMSKYDASSRRQDSSDPVRETAGS